MRLSLSDFVCVTLVLSCGPFPGCRFSEACDRAHRLGSLGVTVGPTMARVQCSLSSQRAPAVAPSSSGKASPNSASPCCITCSTTTAATDARCQASWVYIVSYVVASCAGPRSPPPLGSSSFPVFFDSEVLVLHISDVEAMHDIARPSLRARAIGRIGLARPGFGDLGVKLGETQWWSSVVEATGCFTGGDYIVDDIPIDWQMPTDPGRV